MALTIPVAEIVENSKNPLLGKHESWGRVLLGEIATIQNGFPFKSSQFTRDEGMPLIRIRDVGADSTDTNYVGDYDPAFVVRAGDLLIGMDGDFNCARWRGPDGLLNQRVCRVILKSDIYHPKLLDYALPGYLKAINEMTSSVTVKHLSSKSIAEIPLPLPPMAQQKHIVAEIEKQFSRLDEAVANLKRVKANLKRNKAAVLKAAVEGRLVETEAEIARREGRSYETGAQLLQRILETRRSQWKGKGKYKEPTAPDTTDLPELPAAWVYATAEQLADENRAITYGVIKLGEPVDGGIPVLRSSDVRQLRIDLDDVKRISPEIAGNYRRTFLRGGEVVLTVRGTLGGVAVVPPQCNGFNVSREVAMLAQVDPAMAELLAFFIASAPLGNWLMRRAKGIAYTGINIETLKALPIPVPPIDEQHRIVSEVDRRLTLLGKTEAQVNANLQRAERMRQSILSAAFSTGKLL
jgi:type I restriction enzyme S subunit